MPTKRQKTVTTEKDMDRVVRVRKTTPTEKDMERAENKRRRATHKMVTEIAALFAGLEDMTPTERVAAFLAAGHKLRRVVEDEGGYGVHAVADIASRVPQLRTEERAYQALNLSDHGDDVCAVVLEETAAPMDDGRPLGLGHWTWVFRVCPPGEPAGDDQRFRTELAWLRRESPSEAVLEHVAQVLDRERDRELDEIREAVVAAAEGVRDAVGRW